MRSIGGLAPLSYQLILYLTANDHVVQVSCKVLLHTAISVLPLHPVFRLLVEKREDQTDHHLQIAGVRKPVNDNLPH